MRRPAAWIDSLEAGLGRLRRRPGVASGMILLSSGGLGDTVLLATVFDRFIGLVHPGERLTLVLRQDARGMAFLFDGLAEVVCVDFRRLARHMGYRIRTLSGLRARHARIVVSLDHLRHPDLDEALVAACAGAETIGMQPRRWAKYDARLDLARQHYDDLFDSGPDHLDKVLRWAGFADWLAGIKRPPPTIALPPDRLPPPAVLDAPTVFVQPFSAVVKKQVPPDFLAGLFDELPAGWQIRLTGTASDLARNPAYRALLDDPRVAFDDATFNDLLPRLRAARAVISVDTALMHLAVAAGVPTLCLASAAYVGEIVPYDAAVAPPNVRFVYHAMPCQGCLGDCRLPAEAGVYPCVARLDAAAAAVALRTVLDMAERRAM